MVQKTFGHRQRFQSEGTLVAALVVGVKEYAYFMLGTDPEDLPERKMGYSLGDLHYLPVHVSLIRELSMRC